MTLVKACGTCGHFACVCGIRARHEESCKFRRAAAGAVAIECDHGYDVCPMCDPCTCGVPGPVLVSDRGTRTPPHGDPLARGRFLSAA